MDHLMYPCADEFLLNGSFTLMCGNKNDILVRRSFIFKLKTEMGIEFKKIRHEVSFRKIEDGTTVM